MDFKKLLDIFFTGLNANLNKGFASVVKAIKDTKNEVDTTPVAKAMAQQTATLKDLIDKQAKAMDKLANPIYEVKVDKTPVNIEKPDFSEVNSYLKAIYGAIESGKAADYTDTFDAFGKAIKEAKPKDTIKLDSKQMAGLMAALTSNDPAPNGGLYSGRKVVTTAGTAVQLQSTSEKCENITITAESDNTGIIAVGDSSVVAAEGTQQGAILTPLGSITVKVGDLSKIYIDATVNGDGVTFAYER